MSIQLETTFGDIVIDLDISGSPALCKNILKLCKARYYTNTLIYNIVPGKYCQLGDPRGDGSGGCSIFGLLDATTTQTSGSAPIDVTKSRRRFLRSTGRLLSKSELGRRGTVVAMEMGNIQDTIGSQFLITLGNSGDNGLLGVDSVDNDNSVHDSDATATTKYLSLGTVAEDQNGVLAKLDRSYCDDDGRPYADVRIVRALVISDPYDDPDGMDDLLVTRGVSMDDVPRHLLNYKSTNNADEEDMLVEGWPLALYSPTYDRPPEEIVPIRIAADDTTLFANAGWDDDNVNNDDEEEEDEVAKAARFDLQNKQEEEWRKRQDTSRAVVLEMLGDRPTANVEAPDNVLFVCKLNPYTTDEDLELIFARFDSSANAEIVRDPDTGVSLQYAFVEFTSSEACNEAYLKMNNALVDDRRIKVDFSQSVAKVWDRYNKRYRKGDRSGGIDRGYVDGFGRGNGRGREGRGGERGDGRGYLGRGRGYVGGGNSSASRNSNSLRDVGPSSQAHHHRPNQHKVDRSPPGIDRNERRMEAVDNFGRMTRPMTNETRRDRHHSSSRHDRNNSRNRHSRDDSRSRSSSRDTVEEKRRRQHSESANRRRDRKTRSRSGSRSSSSDSGSHRKKQKKHHKHHSRSHEREKKRHRKRHHHHRRRDDDYSVDDEDERQRKTKHHRS